MTSDREPQPLDPSDGPSLTQRDLELVELQCELQQATSPEEVAGMREAFERSKRLAYEYRDLPLTSDQVADLVLELAEIIEPKNHFGLRSVDVHFADGSHGVSPDSLPRAMGMWAEAYASDELDPVESYREFETIHPFKDGNGRTGHCLWAIAEYRASKVWPTELPPDLFGTESQPA
jgi:Fic family protein